MTQYGIYFDQHRCIGCKTCIVACKDYKDIKPGKASLRKFFDIEEGDDIMSLRTAYLTHGCNHCENPACVETCPVGAITKRDDFGVVVTDRTKCIGCSNCVFKCPWNMPQIADDAQEPKQAPSWGSRHPAQKCDLCISRLIAGKKPICVDACLMRAIEVGPLDMLKSLHPNYSTEAMGFETAETNPSVIFNRK
jgi:anaerobic dimethyl sulfoxide reductase subunit B (iron-sulfur subunit)